ncbi:hypothetical protein ZOD2009_11090 [Haladaptatus paucihalophilus DX253]|uniref:Uncharacterized conserved protein, NAD-dependent epimerase/dehydratase family n=1 Tax=Haladaptatus paucihalophilus DX253 TaxID=797209 RepID=E7QTU0_HALPU|nr:DUF1611 domain-containing protein [Haladaptatus paucihalophilus]EFW92019.1 hypothetical protein ZOD2009_11090 [Haladaptatus paucihalophilus DX253]SHK85911.1 Uncharacterized conserved protein, NAD-dependent epimerase/dehydratase family [Haladaptatus paucihalophilus DX253]
MNLRDAFDAPAPAIVLAEGAFGTMDGKTANGVVMHSELFDARAVIDSTHADEAASDVLGRADVRDVPIVSSTEGALERASDAEALVIGVAPAGGALPDEWVSDIEEAIRAGLDIVSGLHVFLSEQERWQTLADEHGATLFDVRKPPGEDDLRVGDGTVDEADAQIVLTAGTDCAVGKRTTTFELYRAAKRAGLNAGWVATGQTGIMVGAHRGVVIDRVPADFTAGVVEDLVSAVTEEHDIVFVEGQASLTHRAYSSVTLGLLHGAWPDAVVLVDDPDRDRRTHFDQWPVAGVEAERHLVEQLSDATVAAVSTWADPAEIDYSVPAANVYDEGGADDLLASVREAL